MRTIVIGERLLRPRVGDLLEHLAHAGAQELTALGFRLVVTALDAGRFAGIEVLVFVHDEMLG